VKFREQERSVVTVIRAALRRARDETVLCIDEEYVKERKRTR